MSILVIFGKVRSYNYISRYVPAKSQSNESNTVMCNGGVSYRLCFCGI